MEPAWPQLCSVSLWLVFITHSRRRHDYDPAAPLYPSGDGPCADGEEPVQREADGAPRGCSVDRDDQVELQDFFFFFYSWKLKFYFLSEHPGKVRRSRRKRSPPSGSCEFSNVLGGSFWAKEEPKSVLFCPKALPASSAHPPALRLWSGRITASTSITSLRRRLDLRSDAATPCARSPPPTAPWSSSLKSERLHKTACRLPTLRTLLACFLQLAQL